ncbi:GNAT family N-acetyltransferase [bacterium]|nr:GNAT family N-acetyltransferase [bacterium]
MNIIHTNRLKIRELTLEDLDSLHQILSDPETMKFYPKPYDKEQVKWWIDRAMSGYKDHSYGLWALVLKETDCFIGQCGISSQDIDGIVVPEIGYHLNKQYWRQGFAFEAAQACLEYGFKSLNLPKIYIHTWVKNIPSYQLAEKLKMKKIKVYDKHIRNSDLIMKHVVYSMDQSQYDLLQEVAK